MDLKDKTINFLGDSITEGAGVENIEANRFDNVIKRKCGLKRVNNYGVGGSRIAYQRHPSDKARYDMDFCGRCFDMDKNADIIVVFGGVNDYLHGDAPIGNFGDKTRETFAGSVDYLMEKIRELYPDATYVFFTPAHCFCDDGFSQIPDKPEVREEHYLSEYSELIKKTAPLHGFHVFDLSEELKIDPKNEEDRVKYAPDGLHFNDEGHKILADVMIDCLLSI